jgi:hypothetical protein
VLKGDDCVRVCDNRRRNENEHECNDTSRYVGLSTDGHIDMNGAAMNESTFWEFNVAMM